MKPKEKEPDSPESVDKLVAETQKKIQLLESQHNAHYELWHAERKQNAEKIKRLKKSIKRMYTQLNNREADSVRLTRLMKNMEIYDGLPRCSFEKALESLPWKVMEARKKVDSLQHEINQRQQQIEELSTAKLSKKVYNNKAIREILGSSMKKFVSTLENKIHQIEINIMETELLRKKYHTIKDHLMDENIEFESSVVEMEEKIRKQRNEVVNLQKTFVEFLHLRGVINKKLVEKEKKLKGVHHMQENQMDELKYKLESYKMKLERLERHICQLKSDAQKMPSESGSDDAGSGQCQAKYSENIFTLLKEAAGVTKNEDILGRFLWQRDIKHILENMKCMYEGEKNTLMKRKEEVTTDLKSLTFTKVKDVDGDEEKFELIKKAIQEKTEEYENTKKINEKLQEEMKLIMERAPWLKDSLNTRVSSN